MSGGVAYVLDENHDLYLRVNKQMVEIEKLTSEHDMEALRGMIEAHVRRDRLRKGPPPAGKLCGHPPENSRRSYPGISAKCWVPSPATKGRA